MSAPIECVVEVGQRWIVHLDPLLYEVRTVRSLGYADWSVTLLAIGGSIQRSATASAMCSSSAWTRTV